MCVVCVLCVSPFWAGKTRSTRAQAHAQRMWVARELGMGVGIKSEHILYSENLATNILNKCSLHIIQPSYCHHMSPQLWCVLKASPGARRAGRAVCSGSCIRRGCRRRRIKASPGARRDSRAGRSGMGLLEGVGVCMDVSMYNKRLRALVTQVCMRTNMLTTLPGHLP